VRLALVGPAEGQRLHAAAAPTLDAVLRECSAHAVTTQTQTAPLHDLLAGGHELLYSRLFAS
jgi:urease accessory protein UreF